MKTRIIVLILTSMFLFGCNNNNASTSEIISNEPTTSNSEEEKYPDYGVDQTNMFGVGDVLVLDGITRDDIDKRISKMKEMGVKTNRFWLRVGRGLDSDKTDYLFKIENNEMVVNQKYYEDTTYAIEELKKAGISHITLCTSWFYGKEDGQYVYYGGNMPSPESNQYAGFMDVVYETFYKVADLYRNISYIEMGNEYNGNFLSFDYSSKYPVELKTKFIADFSYYATKGIKAANPDCKSVLNGVLDIEYAPVDETGKRLQEQHGYAALVNFFDVLYNYIESGDYPTIGEAKSTDPDDYFEIIAYHPYTFKTINEWIKGNNAIYDVVVKHNDGGKPVFITEWGIAKVDSSGGNMYKEIIANKEKTSYIEVIHYYIFSDSDDDGPANLVKRGEDGEYYYTKSGQVLYEEFGIK